MEKIPADANGNERRRRIAALKQQVIDVASGEVRIWESADLDEHTAEKFWQSVVDFEKDFENAPASETAPYDRDSRLPQPYQSENL